MHPPSNAPSTPAPAKNDAEQRRRAVEVGSYVKKLLDAYRLLEPNHPTLPEIESTTWARTAEYLKQFGELSLELSPTAISIEGKIVVESNRKADSVSFPLFAEGIHEVLFGTGLDDRQLQGFLTIWAEACQHMGSDETQEDDVSVTTKIWESDFDAIELVAMQTVHEGSEEEGEDDHDRRAEIRQAMMAVSGDSDGTAGSAGHRLLGGTGADAGGLDFWGRAAETDGVLFRERLAIFDKSALKLLSAELNLEMSADTIQNAQSAAAPKHLSKERQQAIAQEIKETWSSTHAIHYITSVFMLANDANDEEVDALIPALERVFSRQCEDKEFELMYSSIGNARQQALAKTNNRNYTYQVIEKLMSALKTPEVLDPCVDAIDRSDFRAPAAKLLAYLPPVHVNELIYRIDRLNTPPGINALLEVISNKNPKVNDLAQVARESKPTVARAILKLANKASPEDAHTIRRTVLCHPDAKIRKNILDGIQVEDVPANLTEIRSLVLDPESDIRESAMLLVVQVKDANAIAALSAIVAGEYAIDEQKKAIVGIARIGGTGAGLALRKVFLQQKNIELKCVCALALGEMGDQSARSLLEKEANRVLGRSQLKASCAEAIRRLDAHKSNSGYGAKG